MEMRVYPILKKNPFSHLWDRALFLELFVFNKNATQKRNTSDMGTAIFLL